MWYYSLCFEVLVHIAACYYYWSFIHSSGTWSNISHLWGKYFHFANWWQRSRHSDLLSALDLYLKKLYMNYSCSIALSSAKHKPFYNSVTVGRYYLPLGTHYSRWGCWEYCMSLWSNWCSKVPKGNFPPILDSGLLSDQCRSSFSCFMWRQPHAHHFSMCLGSSIVRGEPE